MVTIGRQSVRAIVIHDGKLLAMKRNKFGQEYHTLIGGGIDAGEDAETALRRELREETSLEVGTVRQVFTEDAGDLYGAQHVYLCEYIGGEPRLAPNSEEALASAGGQDIYEPIWLPLSELPATTFLSESVRDAILDGLQNGFPETPRALAWKFTIVAQ